MYNIATWTRNTYLTITLAKLDFLVDYEQSLFFLSRSSKTRETAALVSHASALPSLNLTKNRDCSQSNSLVAPLKLIGFSTMYNEFQARSQGKKIRFRRWKAKLKRTLEKQMGRHIKANSSSKRDTLKIALVSRFLLIFLSYEPKFDSMFSVKCFCGQYF